MVTYTYDLSGNRLTRTLRNGTSTTYYNDQLNRPWLIQHSRGGSEFAHAEYGYDGVSRITSAERENTRGEAFTYYLDNQLKSARFDAVNPGGSDTDPANITTLVYDANGNRTSQTNQSTPSYSYSVNDLNEYTSVNGSAPGYDVKGNLASYSGWSYQYNAQNQLKIAGSGSSAFNFYYDGLGRQGLRYDNGHWIYSYYDGWDLIEEYTESGTLIHSYLHGAGTDEMVQRFGGGVQTIWYYQDVQGSTTHLADDAGAVLESYKYDPALSGAPSRTTSRTIQWLCGRIVYLQRERPADRRFSVRKPLPLHWPGVSQRGRALRLPQSVLSPSLRPLPPTRSDRLCRRCEQSLPLLRW